MDAPLRVHGLRINREGLARVDGVVHEPIRKGRVPRQAELALELALGLVRRAELHRLRERRLVGDRIVVVVDELAGEDGDSIDLALLHNRDLGLAEGSLDERAATLLACGLRNMNAWFVENFGGSSKGSPPSF